MCSLHSKVLKIANNCISPILLSLIELQICLQFFKNMLRNSNNLTKPCQVVFSYVIFYSGVKPWNCTTKWNISMRFILFICLLVLCIRTINNKIKWCEAWIQNQQNGLWKNAYNILLFPVYLNTSMEYFIGEGVRLKIYRRMPTPYLNILFF